MIGRRQRLRTALLAPTVVAMTASLALATVSFVAVPASAASVGTVAVGPPSWWQGDCDKTHWDTAAKATGWTGAGAHRMGASYLGVPVCGPRHAGEGGPDIRWSAPGWGEYEWECTELAFRFMAQLYGVAAYHANGNTVVSNYATSAGGGLVRINNGTTGKAPQPGDVMSFNSSANSAGHVAVVATSSVGSNGTGSIRLITQNDTSDGWRTLTVKAWVVQPFGSYVPYGWLHDPSGRGIAKDAGDHKPFADWGAFVAQQKLDFEGSASSPALAADASKLYAGTADPDPYIHLEMEGSWFSGHEAPVARLYWAYLGRTPDFSGLTHWAAVHRSGRKLDAISQSFATSSEFIRTYGALDDARFVDLIYTNVLGRPADSAGKTYWTKQLAAGTKRGTVMAGFSQSSEYTRKMAEQVDVVMAYAGMLRRAPSSGELTFGAASDIESIIGVLRASAEYSSRVT